jgi:tetratricopeptide (TPR) repeat protein
VRQTETIKSLIKSRGLSNYASLTPSLANNISQKLDADVFVYGKIIQAGQVIRVYAQLVESNSEEVFKPFQIEGIPENILPILDSLSRMVKDFLIISKLKSEAFPQAHLQTSASTNSPEAYRCYIYGTNALGDGNYVTATEWYLKALEIDSNFTEAALTIPYGYSNRNMIDEAKEWCLKLYKKREQMPLGQRLSADLNYAYYFETPYEEIEYDKQRIKLDDQSPSFHYSLGFDYIRLNQYDKAISEYEKTLELFDKFDIKPWSISNYTSLGYSYHKTGQYRKEKRLYRKAEKDFPDDPDLISMQTILSLTKGDSAAANHYINRYLSVIKAESLSEANIVSGLARIYYEAGMFDKAESYLRKALSFEPENPDRIILHTS